MSTPTPTDPREEKPDHITDIATGDHNHEMWSHWQTKYTEASGELFRVNQSAATYKNAFDEAIKQRDTALAAKDAAEKALQRSYDQLKAGRRFLPSHGSFGEDGINQYEGAMHDAKSILDRAAPTPAPTQEPPAGGVTAKPHIVIDDRYFADVQPEGRGEWMPIETAPKDGRSIILFRGGYVRTGYWDDQKYHSKPRPFWNDIGNWGVEACRRLIPTHWQPLPPPPVLPTEGSGASQIADGLADQRGDF